MECLICNEQYSIELVNQPRVLQCGHSSCHSCVHDLIKDGIIRCPVCRRVQSIHKVDEVPRNYTILEFLELNVNRKLQLGPNVESTTKPLAELSELDIENLFRNLSLGAFEDSLRRFKIDGECLSNCKSEDDLISLGINQPPKTRILLKKLQEFVKTGVPSNLLSRDSSKPVKPITETETRAHRVSVNRVNFTVNLGSGRCSNIYYCGRILGRCNIIGSDGRCGLNNGPQCRDCNGFTVRNPPETKAYDDPSIRNNILHCPRQHVMDILYPNSSPSIYGPQSNVICDVCHARKLNQSNEYYFHCQLCRYDLCFNCNLVPTNDNIPPTPTPPIPPTPTPPIPPTREGRTESSSHREQTQEYGNNQARDRLDSRYVNRAAIPVRLGHGDHSTLFFCGRILEKSYFDSQREGGERGSETAAAAAMSTCDSLSGIQCKDCVNYTMTSPPPSETLILSHVRCPDNHRLQVIHPNSRPSNGSSTATYYCDLCNLHSLQSTGKIFAHCEYCNFDLCSNCHDTLHINQQYTIQRLMSLRK